MEDVSVEQSEALRSKRCTYHQGVKSRDRPNAGQSDSSYHRTARSSPERNSANSNIRATTRTFGATNFCGCARGKWLVLEVQEPKLHRIVTFSYSKKQEPRAIGGDQSSPSVEYTLS